MLITFSSYLISAAAFYWFVAKFAPLEQESRLALAPQQEPCEIIELPVMAADVAKKAA